jgi:hypothetical protein
MIPPTDGISSPKVNMKIKLYSRFFLAIGLLLTVGIATVSANAQTRRHRRRVSHRKQVTAGTSIVIPDSVNSGVVRVLTDQLHGGFDKPFVAIAYDFDDYLALRNLSPSLPTLSERDFILRAVIVVFLGQRPTSGFSIGVNQNGKNSYLISESRPPKGMMVMQMVTSPLKVVSVPASAAQTLTLNISPGFTVGAQELRVTDGEFSSTGGIAGRSTKFKLAGSIKVLRHDQYVTFIFDLNSTGIKSNGGLHTTASGTIDREGKISLDHVDPGTLIQSPFAPLRADGTWDRDGLSLEFTSLPPTVADGFTGNGTIKATLIPAK